MPRLIDADAFIAWIDGVLKKEDLHCETAMALSAVAGKLIVDTPIIEAEPVRHGRWESSRPDAPMFGFYFCSLCGRRRTSPQDHYCPHCGAKMQEVE